MSTRIFTHARPLPPFFPNHTHQHSLEVNLAEHKSSVWSAQEELYSALSTLAKTAEMSAVALARDDELPKEEQDYKNNPPRQ